MPPMEDTRQIGVPETLDLPQKMLEEAVRLTSDDPHMALAALALAQSRLKPMHVGGFGYLEFIAGEHAGTKIGYNEGPGVPQTMFDSSEDDCPLSVRDLAQTFVNEQVRLGKDESAARDAMTQALNTYAERTSFIAEQLEKTRDYAALKETVQKDFPEYDRLREFLSANISQPEEKETAIRVFAEAMQDHNLTPAEIQAMKGILDRNDIEAEIEPLPDGATQFNLSAPNKQFLSMPVNKLVVER